jgi:hypothetical protein
MKAIVFALGCMALVSCSGQDEARTERYDAAAAWCAGLSEGGVERVLWVCHDDAPLVVRCAPAEALSPCDEVMVQP